MIYTFKCTDCKGSGWVDEGNVVDGASKCPTCNGSGNMGLWIPCEKCGGHGSIPNTLKMFPNGTGGVTIPHDPCTCTDGKRPLTVSEVESLKVDIITKPRGSKLVEDAVFHAALTNGILKFNGALVSIAPIKEG